MTDVEQQLRKTLDHYAQHTEVSVDALERMADRRRRRGLLVRAGGFAAVAAAVIALVVAVGMLPRPADPVIEPAGGGDDRPAAGEQELSPDGDSDHARVQLAIERLIAANETAPDRPVPGDGQVLVDRTYAIWASMTVTVDGDTADHELGLQVHDTVHRPGDRDPISKRAQIATRGPASDIDELRDWATRQLAEVDVDELTAADQGFEMGGWDLEAFLQQAETESKGTAEPAPGATERPEQAHAFIAAADALREGLEPADRIRALQAIARIDDRFTDYRGEIADLLGRPGIAIGGYDPSNDTYNVLIFDPETGDLLGEYGHAADPATTPLPISTLTARETFTRPQHGDR